MTEIERIAKGLTEWQYKRFLNNPPTDFAPVGKAANSLVRLGLAEWRQVGLSPRATACLTDLGLAVRAHILKDRPMTDRDKLVEAMARGICEYETPESYDDLPEISMLKRFFRATAQAALAAIEGAGFAVVPAVSGETIRFRRPPPFHP
jgi:hypothetical protein